MAQRWDITRADTDAFGALSQERAATATAEGRYASQIVPVTVEGEDGSVVFDTDEGLRATSVETLAGLRTNLPDGIHTAATSSQVSDGAAAVVLMTAARAAELGLSPLATIVDSCLVGSDPELMLTGPIAATQQLLRNAGLGIGDLGLVEINEAFASVVLAWERELKADMERVNPNGGAIAHGHPLGATGAGLLAKAVHEMGRADIEHALVTMCCGGGLATGTLLRR